MDKQTKCVHGSDDRYDTTGAISVPIFQSATFAHPSVGQSTGYDYSRLQNPTREHLEKTIAALEGGTDALAFSTGMAAIAALMELFSPGDHLVASDDLYGGSHRLFSHISMKNGAGFSFADTSDPDALERAIRPETKALFVETPTNPMMQVTDIAAVSVLARRHGLLLIVDNTFLTPCFQRPLSLGTSWYTAARSIWVVTTIRWRVFSSRAARSSPKSCALSSKPRAPAFPPSTAGC